MSASHFSMMPSYLAFHSCVTSLLFISILNPRAKSARASRASSIRLLSHSMLLPNFSMARPPTYSEQFVKAQYIGRRVPFALLRILRHVARQSHDTLRERNRTLPVVLLGV